MKNQLEDVDACNRNVLEAFVLRARRVEEHSPAQDWEALIALAEIRIKIVPTGNGHVQLRHEMASEETVESAAARVRPILLKGDSCFHMLTLNALGYLCQASP